MTSSDWLGTKARNNSRAVPGKMHIVDQLIEERAPHLLGDPLLRPIIRTVFYPILQYGTAVKMADQIRDMRARDVFDHVSELLNLKLVQHGAENIPESGRFILAVNHPTGIADGFAVFDALKQRRPDMTFFANRDALRVAAKLDEMVIPVEWVEEKRSRERSRETVKSMVNAFRSDKAVVLFPSGRLARMTEDGLRERPWMSTVINLAQKYEAPVLPLHLTGRNSRLYYLFWRMSDELRDMTLFHELLNKKGREYNMTFGTLIPPSDLEGDPEEVTKILQAHVEDELPRGQPWSRAGRRS